MGWNLRSGFPLSRTTCKLRDRVNELFLISDGAPEKWWKIWVQQQDKMTTNWLSSEVSQPWLVAPNVYNIRITAAECSRAARRFHQQGKACFDSQWSCTFPKEPMAVWAVWQAVHKRASCQVPAPSLLAQKRTSGDWQGATNPKHVVFSYSSSFNSLPLNGHSFQQSLSLGFAVSVVPRAMCAALMTQASTLQMLTDVKTRTQTLVLDSDSTSLLNFVLMPLMLFCPSHFCLLTLQCTLEEEMQLLSHYETLRLMKARSKHQGEAEVIHSGPLASFSQHKGARITWGNLS